MNIDVIKKRVYSHLGEKHYFRAIGTRGQDTIIHGYISKCYPAIFTINDDNNNIFAFSYNDALISSIKIIDVNNKK